MPKIKTNKLARKKFRTNAKGAVKRGQCNKSHNTAKRSAKRMRKLTGFIMMKKAGSKTIKKMLGM